jgi:hypothetical protein
METSIDLTSALELVGDHFKEEWAVIVGAPIATAGIVILSFAAVWWLIGHHYTKVIALKIEAIGSKDAAIEAATLRLRLADDRLKDTLRARDEQVERLGMIATEPEKLTEEVKVLRAQLEERQRREWPLLTREQKSALTDGLRALPTEINGRENRRVDIRRDDIPDCMDLADDLADCFRKAGWRMGWEPRRMGDDPLTPGIHVIFAAGDPRAQPLAEVLTARLGQSIGVPDLPASAFGGDFIAQGMVPQILIGRRPKTSE